jgi:hypothetical protein
MENLILEEVKEYMEFLKVHENTPVSLQRQFSLAVLNSLWMILTSKRYKHDDPRLVEIFNQNSKYMNEKKIRYIFYIVAKLQKNEQIF